ncbi:helix-turn-helix transcriptional regulator [Ewingella americana]|jgi:DNA-binding HxlR family transcriptional regulator|uniref:QorR family redox-sensing transcriptional regulator n=3 Tax=Ewingella americana TaxID=41202 RepID=A0A085G0H3_EWIA3|nr:helix-turn-helix transcriptional regulator [Ewingella americana]KFC77218.1 QorR family redox-sensing transcriptional regulator [Ewingella americana ATCC 33852]QMV53876.1 helix-turn-helix transcriptional regulator [Ewingella americana]STS10459.1 HTH-type transcriptional activator hxlR [Ewingella americana]
MKLTSLPIETGEEQVTENILGERLRRGEVMSADCPSREILSHVTSRWGVLVLIALSDGTQRFSELRRKINGVSEKMLAQTLQTLETDGFVDRISYPVVPPHVEYSLTPLGVEVQTQLAGLTDWVETNLHRIINQRNLRLVDKQ